MSAYDVAGVKGACWFRLGAQHGHPFYYLQLGLLGWLDGRVCFPMLPLAVSLLYMTLRGCVLCACLCSKVFQGEDRLGGCALCCAALTHSCRRRQRRVACCPYWQPLRPFVHLLPACLPCLYTQIPDVGTHSVRACLPVLAKVRTGCVYAVWRWIPARPLQGKQPYHLIGVADSSVSSCLIGMVHLHEQKMPIQGQLLPCTQPVLCSHYRLRLTRVCYKAEGPNGSVVHCCVMWSFYRSWY